MTDNCLKVVQNLSAYMDDALAPENRAELEAHIAACASCAVELRRIAELDAEIKRLPVIEPSPFFAARVAAAARSMNRAGVSLRRFLRLPVPAMALMATFILINLFTFAFNINAMENGPRRELARKVVAQLVKPTSMLNPVALSRLCGECNEYMCLCMHEAGKKNICPCKDCEMERMQNQTETGKTGDMGSMEKKDVH